MKSIRDEMEEFAGTLIMEANYSRHSYEDEALGKRHPKSRSRGRWGTPAEVVLRLRWDAAATFDPRIYEVASSSCSRSRQSRCVRVRMHLRADRKVANGDLLFAQCDLGFRIGRQPTGRRPSWPSGGRHADRNSSHFSGSVLPNLIPWAELFPLRKVCYILQEFQGKLATERSPNEPNYLRTFYVASLGQQRGPLSLAVHTIRHIESTSLPSDAMRSCSQG
jgi:hypothetical protein